MSFLFFWHIPAGITVEAAQKFIADYAAMRGVPGSIISVSNKTCPGFQQMALKALGD